MFVLMARSKCQTWRILCRDWFPCGLVVWCCVVAIVIASVFPQLPLSHIYKKTSSTARIRKEGLLPKVEEWVNRVWRCNHFFLHVFFLLMAHSRCTLHISSNSVVFFNVPFIHLTPSQHRRNETWLNSWPPCGVFSCDSLCWWCWCFSCLSGIKWPPGNNDEAHIMAVFRIRYLSWLA